MDLTRARKIAIDLADHIKQRGLSINAAAVAYNTFLALVPLAFGMLGIAALVGQSTSAVEQVDQALDPLVPGTVKDFIVQLLVDAGDRLGGGSVWLILVSIVLALFLGSRAVAAMQRSLAFVEEETERRPAVEMRLVAVGLTIGGGFVLVLTSLSLVVGGKAIDFVGGLSGLGFLDELWSWLRVPIAAAGLYAFLLALYRVGPPAPLPRARLAALVATAGAVVGSLGFGLYLNVSPELGATFGVLGAVAIALVWLYVGALAILAAAVIVSHLMGD